MEKIERNTPEHVGAIDDRRAVIYHPERYYVRKFDRANKWLELTGFKVKWVFNWGCGWHICFEQREEAMLFKLAFNCKLATRRDQRF